MVDVILLNSKTDHDLLVIAVTTINSMDDKLGTVCAQVNMHEQGLTALRAEHDMRMKEGSCPMTQGSKRGGVVASGGLGGLIGAAAVAILNYFFGGR